MKTIARMSRQHILLHLVGQATKHENNDTANPLTCYFVPRVQPLYCDLPGLKDRHTTVWGAGDAAILRGLAKAGFIRRPRETRINNPYVFALTEDGRIELERLAEEQPKEG